ncbi:MAG: NAD(P)/FAD-dependent oxidoreductase [Bacteroidales bacterium]
MLDVLVVGGGPAGLSAALMLGRCRRRVVVVDAGAPRNARSHGVHGFLTRDGVQPGELLRLGREELRPYGVEVRHGTATDARWDEDRFVIALDGHAQVESRLILLATGVVDCLPSIEGMSECYGRSVFHCPYCDGWEVRDAPLAVYARGRRGVGLAKALQTWSRDVAICTDGPARILSGEATELRSRGIEVRQAPIERLEHTDGRLDAIVFRSGDRLERRAVFLNTGQYTRSPLAERLGCQFTRRGAVRASDLGETSVSRVYVAGDASRDVQFVVVAAAEGAKVAYAINVALQAMGSGPAAAPGAEER